jgi:Gluconate 2-dehydrogenase subunit 3
MGLMNRRNLLRNSLLAIGAVTVNWPAKARELTSADDPSVELARADWKPVFLETHQNETLIALSDAIIPATDTPGAKAALVNRFLDLVLSAEPAPTQHAFLGSLAYLDGEAMERYKVEFLALTPEQKDDFLSLLAYPHTAARWGEPEKHYTGYEHFSKLKAWISSAFYSSPAGLKELGWDGSFAHGYFSGCEHSPEEHGDAK